MCRNAFSISVDIPNRCNLKRTKNGTKVVGTRKPNHETVIKTRMVGPLLTATIKDYTDWSRRGIFLNMMMR